MQRQTNWLWLTAACLVGAVLLAFACWQGFVGWVSHQGGWVSVQETHTTWAFRQDCGYEACPPPEPGRVEFSFLAGPWFVIVSYPTAGRAAGTKPTAVAP